MQRIHILYATGGATSANAVSGSVVINTGTEDNPQQVQDASSSYNGIDNKNSRDRHQHGIDINHTHLIFLHYLLTILSLMKT